jgi:serine/threonine-protein kinase
VVAGKYQIERVLGVGGMGVVLAAMHQQLGQRVAIKMLLPHAAAQPEALARFLREARAASSIKSEHVAQVIDVGTSEKGAPFMVMEHLVGLDLAQLLGQRRRVPATEAVDYVLQACEAITQAHRLGIVHRDLKPSNLFLTQTSDGQPLIKVLDFGISKITGPEAAASLTATSFSFGTPYYMSPEQIRSSKHVDPRTDIWALGVILHELIAGAPPFEADSLTALCAIITADPPTPLRRAFPAAPPGVESVVLRCLQKDTASRYQSIHELARALASFGSARSTEILARIERLGVVSLPSLPSLPGPAIDPHGTGQAWETGKLPARSSRLWMVIAAGVFSSALVAWGLVSLVRSIRPTAPTAIGADPTTSAASPASAAPPVAPASATADPSSEPAAPQISPVASGGPTKGTKKGATGVGVGATGGGKKPGQKKNDALDDRH